MCEGLGGRQPPQGEAQIFSANRRAKAAGPAGWTRLRSRPGCGTAAKPLASSGLQGRTPSAAAKGLQRFSEITEGNEEGSFTAEETADGAASVGQSGGETGRVGESGASLAGSSSAPLLIGGALEMLRGAANPRNLPPPQPPAPGQRC